MAAICRDTRISTMESKQVARRTSLRTTLI
jgi:hypothetical protein